MLSNYFKIALRNLRSVYSLINLTGLTVGLATFILIFQWVDDELSFDRFHQDHDRIFRIYQNQLDAQSNPYQIAVTPALLYDYIQSNFPSVQNTCRVIAVEVLVRHGEKAFYQKGLAVDTTFFSLFTFPLTDGNVSDFKGTDKIVLSGKIASTFFGASDPIGETVKIAGQDFSVVGVAKDAPSNSHLQFDFLFPLQVLKAMGWEALDQWDWHHFHTYVKLKSLQDKESFSKSIKDLVKVNSKSDPSSELALQPLTSVYLHSSKLNNDMSGRSDIQYVYIFSSVAIFILLVACINFTNLATARSVRRAKEAGVRKVVGAARMQLMFQFFSESAFYSIVSFVLALLISWLLLPDFNELSSKNLQLNFSSGNLLFIALAVVTACTVMAGIYPAVFLSSLKPVVVFKGLLKAGKMAVFFRRSLVIFQFTLGIALVVGTLVVHHQLNYIRSRDLGYDKENLITFHITRKLRSQYPDFKNELKSLLGVAQVTIANSSISFSDQSSDLMKWEGKDPSKNVLFHQFMVDHDFLKTFSMTLSSGRDFSADLASDSSAVIVNEEAVRQMNLASAVGKTFTILNRKPGTIIGVVKDFNFKTIHKKIEPVVIYIDPENFGEISVRLKKGDTRRTIAELTAVFKKFSPDRPFEFNFVDQEIDKLYKTEERTGDLFRIFSGLSIFISCLGLLGVVMFTTEQRTKEFAIRKTLGASSGSIFMNISKEFLILIVAANVVALPVAAYGMKLWQERFAYFDPIPWFLFAGATLLSIVITWLTIAYFSMKAAITSPVNALKSE